MGKYRRIELLFQIFIFLNLLPSALAVSNAVLQEKVLSEVYL